MFFIVLGVESEGKELFDFGLEGGAVLRAGQTDVGFLAVLEEQEGGDGHDAEL